MKDLGNIFGKIVAECPFQHNEVEHFLRYQENHFLS